MGEKILKKLARKLNDSNYMAFLAVAESLPADKAKRILAEVMPLAPSAMLISPAFIKLEKKLGII